MGNSNYLDNSKSKKYQDVKKSINNYLNQIKIHFDLTEEDVLKIVQTIVNNRKINNPIKKWWHL